MAKTSCKKGQYYCNTDKKCKPIPEGYTVREDGFLVKEGWSAKYKKSIDCNNPKGFSQKAHCAGKKKKMTEESNPRIARKKGQPAKSKKHSDLYTDEDPKGTIHGLGFKDVATAKASVAKIRKSGRSHAHKIQAAIAMEQRARVMGKTSEAAVYRKFINSMKKKTKAMNESKHGDHEYEMIRRQTDNIMVAAKKIKKKVGKGEGNEMAWVQSKITKAADYLDTAADYMTDKESVKEGTLRSWFKGSKSKDGKGGWVNVKTGGTCASDEPGEGVPKCVSRAKYDSMSKKERESAHRRKRAADPNQQEKRGAAKPTYVSTDKPKKKKKKTMKDETEFTSLPLVLEVPQNDGEFKLGLMFRESLEQDRGMLFIFESDDYWTFHMKNTFIPLDIAFIKEDGTIDSIKELDPMSPVPVYPDSEIRYAVEVNRGWFAENGVEVGDRILEEAEEINEVKDKKGKGSGTKDACYYKVKSRYSVWPSAYASGALVKCRKVGAANWGNSRKEEVEYEVNEGMANSPMKMKMAPMKMKMASPKPIDKRRELTPEQEAGIKRYHKNKKDRKERNVGYKPGAFYDKKGKNELTGTQRAIGGQGGFKTRRSSGPSKGGVFGFTDNIGEGRKPPMTPARRAAIKQRNAERTPEQQAKDKKLADDFYNSFMKKEHYSWRAGLEEKKKIDYSEYPELVAQGRGGKTANVDVEPAVLKTYRNVRTVGSLLPAIGKSLIGDKDAFKKQEKAERKRYKNPQGIERVMTGFADKLTKDKYDFDRKGPSKTKKEHYSWRDSFDLDEQALNMAQRRAARGSSYKAPTPKPQPKPAPEAKPAPQRTQASPVPQAKPAAPAPKMGRTEQQNRARLGNERVDALKAKNAQFQAAKKSGTLKQFRADNPKLSGRERAQQMARDRIAAKKLGKPVAPQAKQSTPAPQKGQDALNRSTTPTKPQDALNRSKEKPGATPAKSNTVPSGSFGISAKGKEQAAANRKEVAVNKKEVPVNKKEVPVKNNQTGSVSSSVTSKKTIGVDTSAGKSDTKSLVNNDKTQNVKNAKKVKKDFNKQAQREAEFTGEPAAKVTTGKIEFDKETGF